MLTSTSAGHCYHDRVYTTPFTQSSYSFNPDDVSFGLKILISVSEYEFALKETTGPNDPGENQF